MTGLPTGCGVVLLKKGHFETWSVFTHTQTVRRHKSWTEMVRWRSRWSNQLRLTEGRKHREESYGWRKEGEGTATKGVGLGWINTIYTSVQSWDVIPCRWEKLVNMSLHRKVKADFWVFVAASGGQHRALLNLHLSESVVDDWTPGHDLLTYVRPWCLRKTRVELSPSCL